MTTSLRILSDILFTVPNHIIIIQRFSILATGNVKLRWKKANITCKVLVQKQFECCHLTPFPCAVSDYEASYLLPSKYLKYSHALFTPKLACIKPLQQADRDEHSKTAQNIS